MLNSVTFAYSNEVLVDSIMANYDNWTELSDKLDELVLHAVCCPRNIVCHHIYRRVQQF